MFFQPPDEKSQTIKPSQKKIRRRRKKKKFAHRNTSKTVKKDASKNRPLRLALTMSSWAENFTHAATWQFKHQIAYWKSRAKALEYENRILHDIIRKNCSNSSQEIPEVSNVECVANYEERKSDSEEENDAEEHVEDEENFEVSEEFIQFLTTNAKYKEEARRERARLKEKLEAEDDTTDEMETESPEKQVNSEEAMKELYGENWQRISALEMSLHSQFISTADKDKPMYWPNIPFNFNFS